MLHASCPVTVTLDIATKYYLYASCIIVSTPTMQLNNVIVVFRNVNNMDSCMHATCLKGAGLSGVEWITSEMFSNQCILFEQFIDVDVLPYCW